MNRTRRARQVYAICAGCGGVLDPMGLVCSACGTVVPVGDHRTHRHRRHAARRVVATIVLILVLVAVLVAVWQLR